MGTGDATVKPADRTQSGSPAGGSTVAQATAVLSKLIGQKDDLGGRDIAGLIGKLKKYHPDVQRAVVRLLGNVAAPPQDFVMPPSLMRLQLSAEARNGLFDYAQSLGVKLPFPRGVETADGICYPAAPNALAKGILVTDWSSDGAHVRVGADDYYVRWAQWHAPAKVKTDSGVSGAVETWRELSQPELSALKGAMSEWRKTTQADNRADLRGAQLEDLNAIISSLSQ